LLRAREEESQNTGELFGLQRSNSVLNGRLQEMIKATKLARGKRDSAREAALGAYYLRRGVEVEALRASASSAGCRNVEVSGVAPTWSPRALALLAEVGQAWRKVSDASTLCKDVAEGCVQLVAGLTVARFPNPMEVLVILMIGGVGYGLSIWLDLLALRDLGAARESVIFSTAPFVGAGFSLLALKEALSTNLIASGVLMLGGVALLLNEDHAHWHRHDEMWHEHKHLHAPSDQDKHHAHEHPNGEAVSVPTDRPFWHSHPHLHQPIAHAHPHVSDGHHRHRHQH
jgi:hypothetical protein